MANRGREASDSGRNGRRRPWSRRLPGQCLCAPPIFLDGLRSNPL